CPRLLHAPSGPDVGDPYWAPPAERPFAQAVGADPGRLRIAFIVEATTGVEIHADCVNAVKDAAGLCAELGHEVVEAAPEVAGDPLIQSFTVLWSSGCASTLEAIAHLKGRAVKPDQVEPLTWALYEMGKKFSAIDYLLALQTLQRIGRDVARLFIDHDVWLTPTLGQPPVPLGAFDSTPDNPLEGFTRSASFAPFTAICNMTGQPAMSLPLFWNDEGLPVGTHVIGRFGHEATLFRLAAQLEEARPWAGRRPPVWA
ncbi:MAG: amidase, partial [Deltaproteobacteria bacterium]|nr:amidase [Deltaproteobacteria bacterium]